jgi:hypothetical protein
MSLSPGVRARYAPGEEVSLGDILGEYGFESAADGEEGRGGGGTVVCSEAELRRFIHSCYGQRENYHRLVVQMCDTANQLRETEDAVRAKDKEAAALSATVARQAQMASVGMQLGKRLQGMLVENQELRQERMSTDKLRDENDRLMELVDSLTSKLQRKGL